MPNYTQRTVNTFIKGLITEAGELTFPENASVDELNCELFRDGSRRRRKGFQLEPDGSWSSFTVNPNTTVSFGEWVNVGNDAEKAYLVVQVGAGLKFYDKSSAPYSSQEVSGVTIKLTYYQAPGRDASLHKCQFSSVRGHLVVTSPGIDPFYIKEEGGVFSAHPVNCLVRDFEWQGEQREYVEGAAASSATDSAVPNSRKYDTLNSGWDSTSFSPSPVGSSTIVSDGGISYELTIDYPVFTANNSSRNELDTYISSRSEYPPLTHPWFSGKSSLGLFLVTEWEEVYSGSSIIGNGKFVYNLWEKDRASTSGIPGLTTEKEDSRFSTSEVFFERVFFSGLTSSQNSGKVFFSPVLRSIKDIGNFFQKNDPTSEEISDLLADDGGVIDIPDATKIKKLYALRNSLLVFAENGVWQIRGIEESFKATGYSVAKISNVGILVPESLIGAEGVPFWWSRHGIHTLSFNEVGTASEQNISIGTIQTFWNEIDTAAKAEVQGTYDRVNKKLIWLYPNNNEDVSKKKNRVLLLDVSLQAFYPWEIKDQSTNSEYLIGCQFFGGLGTDEAQFDVVTQVGNDVVTSTGDDVVNLQESPLSNSRINVVFFVLNPLTESMTFGTFNGSDFLDWGTTNFVSYAETGYDFIGDLTLKKTAPYLVVYTRETETGWTGDEESGYTPVGDSSLLVSCYWDFKKNPSSIPQQAYKRQQPILVDSTDLSSFDSPATVITSRLKVRGRGRSLRIRIESEQEKDFIYLGHGLIADVASRF